MERVERAPPLPGKKSDAELMSEIQDGSGDAFTLLVGRYKDQLMHFAYRFLGDYDEADDVVQETFIRVYNNPHSYKPIAKLSTWLYTITGNLAKSQLRRRKRTLLFSFTGGRDNHEGRTPEISDIRNSPDAWAERSLQAEVIQQALDSIPEKFREVVVLSDVQELSYEEIVVITGLNMGTVKSRLSRGRTRLQELLRSLIDE